MGSKWGRRATGALSRGTRSACILIWTLALAGCNPDGQALSPAQPRGATVAFDSLDGLPPGQFQKLVQNLNEEAEVRRLAVVSREQSSAYRVRGYLAVKVTKHQTTVSWVWDVFDQDERRTLRSGKGSTPERLGGCRRHNARPHCAQRHGTACGVPDLACGGPWDSAADRRPASGNGSHGGLVTGSGRNIPLVPPAGRSCAYGRC